MNNNPTVLEINLASVEYNFDFFRSKINDHTKILVVVKASGYGSDSIALAKLLENKGVDYFAVAYADEGIALRIAGIKTPVLVLHPQIQNLELIIKHRLEPNLYSKNILKAFLEISLKSRLKNYPIHLKFNTGLNRLGFKKNDLNYLSSLLLNQESLQVSSIFSHLMASEDTSERDFCLLQIKEFNAIASEFESLFGFQPLRHMTNTSGILNYPSAHLDMVRLGLGLYGFANDPVITSKLKNVVSLKTSISQIHNIEKGDSVGYNRGFSASEKMKAAIIPIGHADGFFRSLGQGKVFVKVNQHKARIIGNICMDMIMIDVTNIPCEEGDEVIIFDHQKQVLEMARQGNTISYEILTSFSDRIKRVVN